MALSGDDPNFGYGTGYGTGNDAWATLPYNQLGGLGKMSFWANGIGAFAGLANIYAGFKALKLQQQAFDFQRKSWKMNYANQVKDYENQLRDRWAARNAAAAARGRNFQSLGDWLNQRSLTGALGDGNYTNEQAPGEFYNPSGNNTNTPNLAEQQTSGNIPGYRANSPQEFYANTSQQALRRLSTNR